jgi:hypothetical protein
MLYALVNNNYQLRALLRHFSECRARLAQATLLAVPHTLALESAHEAFGNVVVFETPLGRQAMPWLIHRYYTASREVEQQIAPRPEDVLLFFTEVEWLNHIVVQHFKAKGAKVVMLEDGGFGTYIPMAQPASESLTLRDRFILAGFRTVPALRQSRIFKVNKLLFPRLPDSAIDTIALYRDVPIHRDTPVRRVAQPAKKPCAVRRGSVIFLNEPLYDYYQTRESYLAGLTTLLEGLCKGFATVHFKFHPRESQPWREEITGLIESRFPEISIIDSNVAIEEIITKYWPEVLASYFSSALLGIEYEGIEPMYLYHLLDDLADQSVFSTATRILRSWGYRFVASTGEIGSGFRSGLNGGSPGGVDLAELVANAQTG